MFIKFFILLIVVLTGCGTSSKSGQDVIYEKNVNSECLSLQSSIRKVETLSITWERKSPAYPSLGFGCAGITPEIDSQKERITSIPFKLVKEGHKCLKRDLFRNCVDERYIWTESCIFVIQQIPSDAAALASFDEQISACL